MKTAIGIVLGIISLTGLAVLLFVTVIATAIVWKRWYEIDKERERDMAETTVEPVEEREQ